MNCIPKHFYGNEGVIGLTRWIEKMEAFFQISFCENDCKVRFPSFTFLDATLTWWNDHAKTIGVNSTNTMT